MKVIGFRASPTEIYYSLIEVSTESFMLLTVERIQIPVSLNFPEKLNYIRKTVKDIIMEFDVSKAGIRITESSSKNLNIERVSFEAILQEVLSCSHIKKYFVGQISNISSKLDIVRSDFKRYIEEKKISYNHIVLNTYNKAEREAILVGIACIKL